MNLPQTTTKRLHHQVWCIREMLRSNLVCNRAALPTFKHSRNAAFTERKKNTPFDPILDHKNSVHSFTLHLPNVHFNIILRWPTDIALPNNLRNRTTTGSWRWIGLVEIRVITSRQSRRPKLMDLLIFVAGAWIANWDTWQAFSCFLLTPWSIVIPEQLIVVQLVNKSHPFIEPERSLTQSVVWLGYKYHGNWCKSLITNVHKPINKVVQSFSVCFNAHHM